MRRATAAILPLLLFCALVSAVLKSLRVAPAVSVDWLQASAAASAYPSGSALYDVPAYLMALAEGHLARAFDTRDAASAEKASALLEQAISVAPADAYLWTALAWTRLALERPEEALDALDQSWRLAPHNVTLGGERVLVAQALGLFDTASADHRLLADWAVLAQYGRLDPASLILTPTP